MDTAQLLRHARIREGLSQAEVAARAGTSQPVVSAYENGRRDPSIGTLRKLVAATGQRLELRLAQPQPELVPPANPQEHADRLIDVLLLADAIGHSEREPLAFPRINSG